MRPEGRGSFRRIFFIGMGAPWLMIGLSFVARLPATLASPDVYQKDVLQEYLFARALIHGIDPYKPTDQLARLFVPGIPIIALPHPTPYPPLTGALFLPFAALDYPTVAAIWLGAEAACLVLCVRLLLRGAAGRHAGLLALALGVALVAWPPVFTDLVDGQFMLPMLVLLVGTRLALLSSRDTRGGALLGLAILLKPIAWPLAVVLALRCRWRAVSAASAVVVLGYAASAWLVGVTTLRLYFLGVLPDVSRGYASLARNQSLWTLGYRLFSGTDWARFADGDLRGISAMPLVSLRSVAPVISMALPITFLIGSLWLSRRESLDRALGIMLCVSIVVSPIAWEHYLVLLMIPISQVIAALRTIRFPRGQTYLALLAGSVLLMPYALWERLALSGAQRAGVDAALPVAFGAGLWTLMPALATLLVIGVLVLVGSPMREPGSPRMGLGANLEEDSEAGATAVEATVP